MKRTLLIATQLLIASSIFAKNPEVGKPLPEWSEGILDIYAVNTGRGESTFFIFPDGTTMLLDAGEVRATTPNYVAQRPDSLTPPYQAYTRFINNLLKPMKKNYMDYMVLSHFHIDHFGDVKKDMPKSASKKFTLSGMPGIGETIHPKMIVDRGWPEYKDPTVPESKVFDNWYNFIIEQKDLYNANIEKIKVGSNKQFILKNKPAKYPTFEIRNLAANGEVWTTRDTITRNYFIPSKYLTPEQLPDENQNSIAMRISYGKFDYFTGGDLPSYTNYDWQCLERPVAEACGPVEAMKSTHHMNYDAMGATLLRGLRPQVIVVHTAKAQQPDLEVIRRIHSNVRSFPGKKDVFATNQHPATPFVCYPQAGEMPASQGHILIRVMPGGDQYYVYALDDTKDGNIVKSIHGPYQCR